MSSVKLNRKPRFSVLTILLLTAVIAVAVSHFHTSRELSAVRQQLTTARNELSYLDANDNSAYLCCGSTHVRSYAVALANPVFLSQGRYRIPASSSQIPESGLPAESSTHNHVFLDSCAKSLPGGEPFILSLPIHKNESDQWVTTIRNPNRGQFRPNTESAGMA